MIHPTDQFFEEIASEIIHGIENKNFEFLKIKNRITSHDYNFLGEFQRTTQVFNSVSNVEGVKPYNKLFIVIKNILITFIKQKNINENFLNTEEVIQEFIKYIVDLLILEKLCVECNSSTIYQTANPYNENETIHYCRNCQKTVKPIRNTQHAPLFLMYIDNWVLNGKTDNAQRNLGIKNDKNRDFLVYIFSDCLEYFKNAGDISSFITFYKIFKFNNINHEILNDPELLKKILLIKLERALKSENFYDFFEGKKFYNNSFGEIDDDFHSIFINSIIDSLKSGDILKIKFALENFKEDKYSDFFYLNSDDKIKGKIEKNFYNGLSRCLEYQRFENFRLMIGSSIIFDIFIDVKKIPNRFEIASKLIFTCYQEVTSGLITSLGKILYILRFFNEFHLFDKKLSNEDLKLVKKIKEDKLFLLNLKDIFGDFTNCLILFIVQTMPNDLYNFFMGRSSEFSEYSNLYQNSYQIIRIVLDFFNGYSIYGLSVQKLGRVRYFLFSFIKKYKILKNKEIKFIEFDFKSILNSTNRRHLISPPNIVKNMKKIRDKENYNFYNLSMVLLGGLGPQGHGFTYSTPNGEVVEICSDIKENNAIIVKYKQYLKVKFLSKLKKEMHNLGINETIIEKIEKYLSEILEKRELINYYKKTPILNKINDFLKEQEKYQSVIMEESKDLIDKISNAITIILRPIKMIDQFKARMDLVSEDKIKSEEIASLTSLKDKSHYDVLRERFFFQYQIKWFYKIYVSKNSVKKL
jgi:hypothetical protein